MKVMYRVKIDKNTYISGSSLQSTKDRYLALCSKEKALRNLNLVDKGVLEEVTIDTNKPCKVGDLRFNHDDTYGLISVDGAIIHESKAYIWIVKLDKDSNPISGSVEKHKRSELNTRCIKTGTGVSICE